MIKKRGVRTATLALLVSLCLALQLPRTLEASEAVNILLAAGTPGGGWYSQAGIVAEVIKKGLPKGSNVTVVPGGGVSNIVTVSQGNTQLAYAHTIYANWAKNGGGPFDAPQPNIRAIATLDQNYLLILAMESSRISSLSEVAQKKIPVRLVTQRPSSDGGGFLAAYVFSEYGWGAPEGPNYYSILRAWGGTFRVVGSHGEAVSLLRDGMADIWVLVAADDHPQVTELITSRKVRFLPIDNDVLATLNKKYGLPTYVVPAGTFKGQDKGYATIGIQTVLTANANVSDDVVYAIIKALAEHREELVRAFPRLKQFNPETSWQNTGYPLHRGAEKYYKEMGYMK